MVEPCHRCAGRRKTRTEAFRVPHGAYVRTTRKIQHIFLLLVLDLESRESPAGFFFRLAPRFH